jgi:putative transposase
MRLIDEQYTRTPFYGIRKMGWWLGEQGYAVNAKRVRRLMRQMGLKALYPKPRLSVPGSGHKIYPYRLRSLKIDRPDHVWASDITYIRLRRGLVYLVAILDWFSRYVLAWEVSISLESAFCVAALDWALTTTRPEIFNTDKGAQFTSEVFTNRLEKRDITISMDGRGRAIDNIFIERLWRTVKYEEVYLKDYVDVLEAVSNLKKLFHFLQSRTPASVVGLSDASGDLLWESEMRLRRDKAGNAAGRPSWRSSFLGDPGAKFLCGKLERGTKKEKSSKKERKEGLCKLTLLMGIRKERGFPQQLEKSLAKDVRLFHSSHRPNNKDLSTMYCRRRSTLRRPNFGPKNGEHLREEAVRIILCYRRTQACQADLDRAGEQALPR